MNREEALEELVRWLAIPYGENPPVFATRIDSLGQELPAGRQLAELYSAVTGVEVPPMESLYAPPMAYAGAVAEPEVPQTGGRGRSVPLVVAAGLATLCLALGIVVGARILKGPLSEAQDELQKLRTENGQLRTELNDQKATPDAHVDAS